MSGFYTLLSLWLSDAQFVLRELLVVVVVVLLLVVVVVVFVEGSGSLCVGGGSLRW